MAEVYELEPLDLWEVWPHEALDFTPWLAGRLHLLGKATNLDLELVGKEVTLPGAGRVDILAKQSDSGVPVVIENQPDLSDDEHCLALLGYAASAKAGILIWVAGAFTEYHRSIIAWLNESAGINAYAVEVRAYRAGNTLAACFRLAVGPHATRSLPDSPAFYARFYPPLLDELRRSGLPPMGRSGFRGKWRSFETGYPGVVYAAELGDGKAHAFWQAYGDDKERVYDGLAQRKDAIDSALDGEAAWERGDGVTGTYWVGLATEAAVDDPDGEAADAARRWLAANLLRLRDAIQPYLDQVMAELGGERDGGEASE